MPFFALTGGSAPARPANGPVAHSDAFNSCTPRNP
ncbi:hypothetical protein Alide_2245 [Alicycliphilus denitrificans BC]|nr:hypothetical protein Alide_2245 [Alicycliphilus denitrificans BC]